MSSVPRLLSCGSNGSYQLGLGHANDVSTFQSVPDPVIPETSSLRNASLTVQSLASGAAHTLLLLADLADPQRTILFGVGTNAFGQLGRKCALRDDEDVQVMRHWTHLDLIQEMGMSEGDRDSTWSARKIAVTWTSSFVVYRRTRRGQDGAGATTTSGEGRFEEMIVACGSNDFNELGDLVPVTSPGGGSSSHPRIVHTGLEADEWVEHIKGGQRHVVVIISKGHGESRRQRIVVWGAGRRGELDMSTIGGESSASVSSNNKGKGKGKAAIKTSTFPPTTLIPSTPLEPGEQIIDLSLGASHSVALTDRGRVLAWGSNSKGQISTLNPSLPSKIDPGGLGAVAATWSNTYLLTRRDCKLLSQGSNNHSQLLRPLSTDSVPRGEVRQPFREEWTIVGLIGGSEHLLVHAKHNQTSEGAIWAGGWNEHGNLGVGDQEDRGALERVALGPGNINIKGAWAGCATSWVWVE